MAPTKMRALLSSLFLVSFLLTYSGCGLVPLPPFGSKPDRVRVEITQPSINPAVFISDAKVVQHLYAKLYALSLPGHSACPADAGPAYILTFSQGSKYVTRATIERQGCGTVSIQGEPRPRQLTSEFWSFVAQSTTKAMAPTSMIQLAIQPFSQSGQPELQTAQITSAATTQQLYTAILALPHQPSDSGCLNGFHPTYQLAFHATNQLIPAQIDTTECHIIVLSPLFSDTVYFMDQPFEQFLKQILAKVSFAPAQPDALFITNMNDYIEVSNTALIRRFYTKFMTLQPSTHRGCPSDTNEIYYFFHFSQWSLPLPRLTTVETGKCTEISSLFGPPLHLGPSLYLQGDADFWNFVHRTTGQR